MSSSRSNWNSIYSARREVVTFFNVSETNIFRAAVQSEKQFAENTR